jgi:hypothetical protein
MGDEADRQRISGVRVLEVYTPTSVDLTKAKALSASECPRRYCWWWRSLSFEWGLGVKDGCTFLRGGKESGYSNARIPCCRSDPSSKVDHFEAREPHLNEDHVDPKQWIEFRAQINGH